MELSKILEGWRNNILPSHEKKALIESVKNERMGICSLCEYNSANTGKTYLRPDVHCTDCKCPLSSKTACLSCQCPLSPPKWEALLTEKEDKI